MSPERQAKCGQLAASLLVVTVIIVVVAVAIGLGWRALRWAAGT